MGNAADAITSLRRKSLVFHVMRASGFVFKALARIGASLVGKIVYARRTCISDGAGVISGGISKNAAHAVARCGNLNGIFRSASSITCGEMTGIISWLKHIARIVPAAPCGELSPARSALVSMNTRNLFGIALAPNIFTRLGNGFHNEVFRVDVSLTNPRR